MYKEEWSDTEKKQVTTSELENINEASALWTRSKSEITEEQYQEFYKNISHDFEGPLCYSHNRVEGRSEFTQLLFVPKKAPFDLWDRSKRSGLKLYVKRVFIMDDSEQLMPSYLRFVAGVIDSADLPLNVSREILQESRDVKFIRESSTKRVLSMLEDLANNEDETKRAQYQDFWNEFGQVLKEGTGEDSANLEKISGLLRFASTNLDSDSQITSLKAYVERMKEGQEKIYYLTAESYLAAKNSPHLEIFKKKALKCFFLLIALMSGCCRSSTSLMVNN
jgi:molecular chaperone HtpG